MESTGPCVPVDGWAQSILGGFLDPLADKVLVAALALPLAYQGRCRHHQSLQLLLLKTPKLSPDGSAVFRAPTGASARYLGGP